MKLTKTQRAVLFERYSGRCAYCGDHLKARWCADHVEPVIRETRYERGKGFVQTGRVLHDGRDTLANMLPSCPPCNISKGSHSLEGWRRELLRSTEYLERNYPTFRTAVRFRRVMVEHVNEPVRFYFEDNPAEEPTP